VSIRPWLKWTCVLETISFVMLLAAMAVGGESAVSAVGAVHGLLFLGYVGLLLAWRRSQSWSTSFTLMAVLTGPVGPVVVLERLRHDT
jgi:integral membrane protein